MSDVCAEIEEPWTPFQPVAMDDQFFMVDMRTQETPFAVLIDAINTDKLGGRHVKPSRAAANDSVRNAIELLQEGNCASICVAALHCLFAMQCLKLNSPVVALAGFPPDAESTIAALRRVITIVDDKLAAAELLLALDSFTVIFVVNGALEKSLSTLRGWAWSSNIPGIVMYIDVIKPVPGAGPAGVT